MKADVHMHTNFSHDSDATPEEMVEAAIQKGLQVICFTDHYDKDYIEDGKECIFDLPSYISKMLEIKETYKQAIDVRLGIELGLQPHLGSHFSQVTKVYPFDFVIGSVHAIKGSDPYYGYLFQDHTDEEVYRMAFEETLVDIKNTEDFDVLGHIDYVVRYGKEKEKQYRYEKYADLLDEILKTLIDTGRGIELNMAGLKYGLPFAHPCMDVLKRYRSLGGEIITIGADGHKPEHIAYDFSKAKELLKAAGFAYYSEFVKRKPVFKQLS